MDYAQARAPDNTSKSMMLSSSLPSRSSSPSIANRLPPEIICAIFEECVLISESDDEFCPTPASARVPPLHLGLVCSAWRAILNSLPSLWTSLRIDLPGSPVYWDDWIGEALQIIQTWLRHSSDLPISIAFVETGRFPPHLAVPIATLMRDHAHRWKALRVVAQDETLACFMHLVYIGLPRLERLDIRHSRDFTRARPFDPWPLESILPRLTSLTWNAFIGDATWLVHSFCLQLTELTLLYEYVGYSIPLDRLLDVLARMPNLVTCNLGLPNIGFAHIHVTLPRLQTLRLRRPAAVCISSRLISSLTLPKLQRLEIDSIALYPWITDEAHELHVSDMILRSECSLEAFVVRHTQCSQHQIVSTLMCTPHLRELSFIARSDKTRLDSFLDFLRPRAGAPLELPYLENLEIGFALDWNAPLQDLLEVVRQRVNLTRASFGAGMCRQLSRLRIVVDHFLYFFHERDEEVEDLTSRINEVSRGEWFSTEVVVRRAYQPVYSTVSSDNARDT